MERSHSAACGGIPPLGGDPAHMYTVYVLKNLKGRFYIGYTSKTAQERSFEHNSNKCQWTKNKGPWSICHIEQWPDKESAYRRELQIKKYKGGRAFKALINCTERSHSPV